MSKRTATAAPPAPTFPPELLAKLGRVDTFALDQLAEFSGPSVFNPIIGTSAGETFDNLESAMQFLHTIMAGDGPLYDARRGLALYVRTLWAAVQYEAFRCEQKGPQQ